MFMSGSPRRAKPRLLIAAVAGVLALVLPSVLATASPPSAPPAPNEFVVCTLNASVVNGIAARLRAKGIPNPAIDYIVVYTNDQSNHGQVVPGGTTGPVICTNPARVTAVATTSDTPIPGIDIIETDQSLQVQFQAAGGGDINTLLCTSYADTDKCKRIAPTGTPQ